MANPNPSASQILTRLTEPQPLLTLDEAKAHLRVDFNDDDTLIYSLISMVTAALDGPSGEYGYPVTTQRWSLTVAGADGQLSLPITPVQSLFSLTYWPQGGGAQITATLSDYRLVGDESWAYVEPVSEVWPALADRLDALTVTFNAGYSALPEDIKHAARMMLAGLYQNREAVGASVSVNPMLDRIINLRKRWWL